MWKQLEPTNWLDEAILDLTIFRLKHQVWIDDHRVWQKWLRSSD